VARGFTPTGLRHLGWSPVGVDLSANMLRHARHRPTAHCGRFDAENDTEPTPIALALRARCNG